MYSKTKKMTGSYRTLLFILAVTLLASCKKGENDPFLSLSSRKARMHGDWNIADLEYNERTTNTDGDFTDITRTFEEDVITQITTYHVEAGSAQDEVDTMYIAMDYVNIAFDRNGTWSSEFNIQAVWTDFQVVNGSYEYDTVITTIHLKESGDWSFLGAVQGEYKNKERIVMNVLSRESTEQITSKYTEIGSNDTVSTVNIGDQNTDIKNYHSGEQSTIIEIDQLKRKEMIFLEKRRQSGSSTIVPYQGISTTSENDEFYSNMRLVLHRK